MGKRSFISDWTHRMEMDIIWFWVIKFHISVSLSDNKWQHFIVDMIPFLISKAKDRNVYSQVIVAKVQYNI